MKRILSSVMVFSCFAVCCVSSATEYEFEENSYEEELLTQTPAPTPTPTPTPAATPTSVCVVAKMGQQAFHFMTISGAVSAVLENACPALGAPAKKACFTGVRGARSANIKAKHYFTSHCTDGKGTVNAGVAPFATPALDRPACQCTCANNTTAVKDNKGNPLLCMGGPELIAP